MGRGADYGLTQRDPWHLDCLLQKEYHNDNVNKYLTYNVK